ncbi:metallophosphoesterase [Paenibacillus sp. MMS20-IR301]|uniref:metallophosphoesterase n=1 Tax=Paenibacillus sp. MMS20-IR301 TaxID=2895946 RepID=UPI0028E9AF98|nr:metallophosphoesterase [Paenibacillus sp. MMS20-IR301]WNS40843.1 metallophosphoesterase [Paenibacillus sp. MMS20-IR301]
MRKLYIADPHFGHENVIKHSNRPFASIEEMDQTLIRNWNSVVESEDQVYIIGDFLFRARNTPGYYLDQLKGRKHLIRGNHEQWTKKADMEKYFESVGTYLEIDDGDKHIVLFHYPIGEWARYYRGSIHIFGHIHNSTQSPVFKQYLEEERMLNAGVDINCFFPVTLDELISNNNEFRRRYYDNGGPGI